MIFEKKHQTNFMEQDIVIHSFIKERRKEMFYLTNALNTFYLQLYDIRHMIKDHSDYKRGNPLPPHGLFFPINSKDYFICVIPQTG